MIDICAGCDHPIEDDETPVYADDGEVYHMGHEFDEVYNEVGSGGFER